MSSQNSERLVPIAVPATVRFARPRFVPRNDELIKNAVNFFLKAGDDFTYVVPEQGTPPPFPETDIRNRLLHAASDLLAGRNAADPNLDEISDHYNLFLNGFAMDMLGQIFVEVGTGGRLLIVCEDDDAIALEGVRKKILLCVHRKQVGFLMRLFENMVGEYIPIEQISNRLSQLQQFAGASVFRVRQRDLTDPEQHYPLPKLSWFLGPCLHDEDPELIDCSGLYFDASIDDFDRVLELYREQFENIFRIPNVYYTTDKTLRVFRDGQAVTIKPEDERVMLMLLESEMEVTRTFLRMFQSMDNDIRRRTTVDDVKRIIETLQPNTQEDLLDPDNLSPEAAEAMMNYLAHGGS